MNMLQERGGAGIGWTNVTWPFAILSINKNKLELNASIVGKLIFKPTDIISIEPYSPTLSTGKGIKINHCVDEYKSKVIFWTSESPMDLIQQIEKTGFLNNTDSISSNLKAAIDEFQSKGSFPIKTSAAIVYVVIWNILLFFDFQQFLNENLQGSPLGTGTQLALGFIFLTCVLLLSFKSFGQLILKKGRDVQDIREFVYFTMFLCGCMFLIITLFTTLFN